MRACYPNAAVPILSAWILDIHLYPDVSERSGVVP